MVAGYLAGLLTLAGAVFLLMTGPLDLSRELAVVVIALVTGALSASHYSARRSVARAVLSAQANAVTVQLEKRRTETILGTVSDGILVYDSAAQVVYANAAAAKMFGVASAEALVGKRAEELHRSLSARDEHGRAVPFEHRPVALALAGQPSPEKLLCIASAGAPERWLLGTARPVHDTAGAVVMVVSVLHDLTERIRRERSLEDSARDLHRMTARLEDTVERLGVEREAALSARAEAEESLRRIIALQSVAAALAEAQTVDEVANVVLDRGTQALSATGGALLAFSPQGESLEVLRASGLPVNSVERWAAECAVDRSRLASVLRRDGLQAAAPADVGATNGADTRAASDALHSLMGTETLAVVPVAARNRSIGLLAFSLPETGLLGTRDREFLSALGRQCAQALDRTRLFAAEREARTEAEHASRAKTEFLAVVSHELRTPLNAILGYEELLETEVAGPMTDVQKHHLARIRESTRHLLALIEQILSLSRTQSGKEDLRLEDVDATALARDAVALLAPQIQRKGLTLDLALPEEAVGMRTDPRKVRQILLNLLSNAVKFTESGGVTLELTSLDGSLVFRIRDTGPGVSDDERERIFEPFYQNPGEGKVSSGTGLGLPVARELARNLGGDVVLESGNGRGSTFTVQLPNHELGEPTATETSWVGGAGEEATLDLSQPPRPT
jgi:signal transduction histidine kinase/PAS domain-containing protein